MLLQALLQWGPRQAASADASAHRIHLPAGAARRCTLPAGARLRVCAGRVWLTEPGDPDDRFLSAGDEWQALRGGRVVLEAQGDQPAVVQRLADAAG